MDWFNSVQGKLAAMVIGGAVLLLLDGTIRIPNFKPQLQLKDSAPDWATALTWGMAAAIFAAIFAYFKFGPKIAGPRQPHWSAPRLSSGFFFMVDWKSRFPAWKGPALSGALSRAANKINAVIAILIFVVLGLAADAYFHTAVDHAPDRNQATFSQEVNEQLATSFIGGSIGLIIAALLCGLVFVVFEAPMRLYWAALGSGSAYVGWLYFGGRALGQ